MNYRSLWVSNKSSTFAADFKNKQKTMTKTFIIDLLPEMGAYATTMFGDICTISVARLATKFTSRKEAMDYMKEHFSEYKDAKIRTFPLLDAPK